MGCGPMGRMIRAAAFISILPSCWVDPYAKRLDRPFVRSPRLRLPRAEAVDTAPLVPKAIVVGGGSIPLAPRRKAPQLFYELNIRGYTMRHPDVPPGLRGTVAGLGTPEVIDHLKALGVDTVELMPVAAFIGRRPSAGARADQCLGLQSDGLFRARPAARPARRPGNCATSPGSIAAMASRWCSTWSTTYRRKRRQRPDPELQGLDALSYYRHVEIDGQLQPGQRSGHRQYAALRPSRGAKLVVDSLRYWVEETGVSGFRFDLAPILGRDPGFDPQCPDAADDQGRSAAGQMHPRRRAVGPRSRPATSSGSSARNSTSGTTPIATRCGASGRAGAARSARWPASSPARRKSSTSPAAGRRPGSICWPCMTAHPRRSGQLRRQAQRGQWRGQPRRPFEQFLMELWRRRPDRQSGDHLRRAGATCGRCSPTCSCRVAPC